MCRVIVAHTRIHNGTRTPGENLKYVGGADGGGYGAMQCDIRSTRAPFYLFNFNFKNTKIILKLNAHR